MPYRIHFLLAILMVITFQVEATPIGFKGDKAGFDTAVAGLSDVSTNILDFESQTAGTIIPSGTTLGGITLNDNLSPLQMTINDFGQTTSDPNTLAVNVNGSPDSFELGDRIDVSFQASNAFGFFLIVGSAFDFFDNDVIVTFGGEAISIVNADVPDVLFDPAGNSFGAIWLGLVDDMATHTTATIQFGLPSSSIAAAIGEIDDITTTRVVVVSEPAVILLFGAGLLGLFGCARRR